MNTIFDNRLQGRPTFRVADDIERDLDPLPAELLGEGLDLPSLGEPDLVRHYTALSRLNFGVDSGMYPLGSCTMKYNPKINEKAAARAGFADVHPLCGEDMSQGCLEVMFELGRCLAVITGMDGFSLAPAAGAHGEMAGVMVIKKYFESLKEKRDIIIIPDTAHGTNPASVAMCGFETREVPSDAGGNVDIGVLDRMVDDNVAAMMLTSPNTLGLFDRGVSRIAEILHAKGALFYCDGANLNAVMGRARVADMGFDLMHVNLHKTFSTPHGGGGPGSGPVGVRSGLERFLPVPVVCRHDNRYCLDYDRPDSIGRIHSFYGNFLIALRAFVYINMLGPDGIREVSENAVLNANYLLAMLKDDFFVPIERPCMHEFVISDRGIPNGVTTNDIAKRLLDYGFHAPTVYFPLLVPGAMMIEPTETENRQTLERFADALIAIKNEAQKSPEIVKSAPHSTPVRRVDAVLAARKPVLKWTE